VSGDGIDTAEDLDPQDEELAGRLDRDRPVPNAGFRGALARHLTIRDPGYGPRPARLWAVVSGYLGAGAVLIAIGALQATGHL
jgi:hypothetical protein